MNEAFLWALIAMHYYWYFMIVRMTWRALTKGVVKDDHNDVAGAAADEKQTKSD